MNATTQLARERAYPQAVGMPRVIHNSVVLVLLDLLNKAIPLVVFPRVVRALGPAVYGQLGFASAVAGFFGLLASPGFSTYALREAAKDSGRVSLLVKHVLGARIVFATGAYALLAFFTLVFAPHDGQTHLLILLSGLAFVTGSLDTQWIFAARSRMTMIAVRGALAQLAYAGLILALVRGSGDAWIIPLATLVSLGLSALLIWLPARREYHIPLPEISPRAWGMFLPICLVMGLSSLMSMIYDQIDVIMLKYFRPDAELGTYVASYGLMTMAMSFLPILSRVFLPLLSETAARDRNVGSHNAQTRNGEIGNEKKYLRWLGNATIGLALPIAVGGFILAAPLTQFVFGSQYSGSETLFRWLTLTIVTATAASYCGAQLIPNGREKKYFVAVLAGASTNVVLNLVLIPKYGTLAAAFTTAISQGVVALMNCYFVRDLTNPPLLAAVALSVPATGVMAVSLVVMPVFFRVHVLVLITLGALAYAGAYALSLVFLKSDQRAERPEWSILNSTELPVHYSASEKLPDLRIQPSNFRERQRPAVAVLLSGGEKFSAYYGGALARWTYEVYSRLTNTVDVTIFGAPTEDEDLYPLSHQSNGISRACDLVSRIPIARRYEQQLWLRALMPQLRKFDLLHIHNRPQWVTVLRHMGYRGALVLHLQNDHLGHWTSLMLDDLALRLDRVVACSSFLRDCFALKSPALAAKTQVVSNGVNCELFFPREEARERKTILFVGRLDAEKGVLQLIQAYARILQAHPDAKLVIGGTTGFGIHEETAYVRRVRELANSVAQTSKAKILFTGYIHHDRDLPSWFQKATIFASPSLFQEPFGLVNAEAMACATPVVGSNRGGIPEVLGDTGRVVDPEDIKNFADTLSALLAQPAQCAELGAAGYERCRRMFDWQLIAGNWADLLEDVVRPANQRARRGT